VDAFLAQTDAVIAHDASAVLGEIDAPTLITFGARDLVCGARFAERLKRGIAGSELVVFEHLYTLGCTRTRRRSTARRSTSCCASARDADEPTTSRRSKAPLRKSPRRRALPRKRSADDRPLNAL
jgi:hypothetical protein